MYTNHINPVAQKNQDAFCTALFQLLLKKPLEKISVTELCHMADLDRTTFYRSFESKDDVLDYYPVDRLMHDIALALMAVQTQTTEILDEFPTKAARAETAPQPKEIPQS